MRTRGRASSLRSIVTGFLVCLLPASAVDATTLVFRTDQGEFDEGVQNRGWWTNSSDSVSSDGNDNYVVGNLVVREGLTTRHVVYRNFFTFDLSSLSLEVTSATLRIQRGNFVSPDPSETIEFFDVSTPAAVVNDNSLDPVVFDDLGTGTSYGSFVVDSVGDGAAFEEFDLTPAALADIDAVAGGYFSIGGTLTSIAGVGDERIFGSTGGVGPWNAPTELVLTVVPEPSTALLVALGLVAVAIGRRDAGLDARRPGPASRQPPRR